jgi:predicted kinase
VARIIAEAGVRLVADSKGFGASIRSSIRAAMKEASLEAEQVPVFQNVEKEAERTASRSGSARHSRALSSSRSWVPPPPPLVPGCPASWASSSP